MNYNLCHDVIWHTVYGNLTLQTEFTSLSSDDKLAYLLNEHPRKTAKYIVKACLCRKTVMYSWNMIELNVDTNYWTVNLLLDASK